MTVKTLTKLLVVAFLLAPSTLSAQDDGTDKGPTKQQYNKILAECPKHIKVPLAMNPQGRVRADLGLVCYDTAGERIFVFFRASAMNKATYQSGKQAPWLHLKITDKKGNKRDIDNFEEATVMSCGGYTNHMRKLPEGFKWEDIDEVRFSLGGAAPDLKCSGQKRTTIDLKKVEEYVKWAKRLL